jgi:hypothetical protein
VEIKNKVLLGILQTQNIVLILLNESIKSFLIIVFISTEGNNFVAAFLTDTAVWI